MRTSEKKAWITLDIDVECESCSKPYSYVYTIKEEGWAGFDIEGRVMDRLKTGDFGVKKCPSCGYIQSWMQRIWKEKWQNFFGCLTAFPLTILLGIWLKWPEGVPIFGGWLPLLFYVIALILFSLPGYNFAKYYINPNRSHRSGGYEPKEPNISIRDNAKKK